MVFGIDQAPSENAALAQLPPGGRRNAFPIPNPFMLQAQQFLPRTVKQNFKFGRWIYYQNSVVHSVLSKIPSYVVTDLTFKPDAAEDLSEIASVANISAWKKVFNHEIKIRPLLKGVLMDWQAYGNGFVMMMAQLNEYYRCSGACGQTWEAGSPRIKFIGMNSDTKRLRHKCDKCGEAELIDTKPEHPAVKWVRAIRLNPESITIEYNPLNGDATYYYRIPDRVKKCIRDGDADYTRNLPPMYVKAAFGDGILKIFPGWLFHFKSVGLAEDDMGWGKSMLMPVMSDIFSMAITTAAEEMILQEHIVPLRILFANAANGMVPAQWTDLGAFNSQLQQWLQIWKVDKNAIPISNFPVGVANVGGDSRALLSTPQIQEFLKLKIINGCGVPREFVEGGLSYTNSSMSIRMIKNTFTDIRLSCKELIDFVKEFVKDAYKFSNCEIDFIDLQMADDTQKTNTWTQWADRGWISVKTLLTQGGLDSDKEMEQIKAEKAVLNELKQMEARAAAESQAETQEINARAAASAEYENWKSKKELQDREQQREAMDMQVKRRAALMGMGDQELQARIQAGFASVSDITYLVSQGRIPIQFMQQLQASVEEQQKQVLNQLGIDDKMLDGLPPDVALMVSNLIIPPRDLQAKLMQMQQQAAQEQANAEAAAGGQPQGPAQAAPAAQGQPQQAQPAQAPSQAQAAQQKVAGYAQQLSAAKTPQERSMIEAAIKAKDPQGFQQALAMVTAKQQDSRPEPESGQPRRKE